MIKTWIGRAALAAALPVAANAGSYPDEPIEPVIDYRLLAAPFKQVTAALTQDRGEHVTDRPEQSSAFIRADAPRWGKVPEQVKFERH